MDDGGLLDIDVQGGLDADGDGGAVGGHCGQVVKQDEGEGPARDVHDQRAPPVLVRAVQALGAKSAIVENCLKFSSETKPEV